MQSDEGYCSFLVDLLVSEDYETEIMAYIGRLYRLLC
jgi:hypothetical protein